MKTIRELGRLIKQKYPGAYDDLTDDELGRMIKQKYPGAYDDYADTAVTRWTKPSAQTSFHNALAHLQNNNHALQVDPHMDGNLQKLWDYYDPRRGVFTSWWQRRKSEARNRLMPQLHQEQRELIEQWLYLQNAVLMQHRTEADFKMWLASNAAMLLEIQARTLRLESELMRLQAANEIGVSLVEYERRQVAEYDDNYQRGRASFDLEEEIKRETFLSQLRVAEEEAMSRIRLRDYEDRAAIEFNNKLREKQEAVRLSIISKNLSDIQRIALVQEQIDDVYRQIDDIEADRLRSDHGASLGEAVKRMMIEDRREIIDTLKEFRRARERRLREIDIGRTNAGGVDEDADLR